MKKALLTVMIMCVSLTAGARGGGGFSFNTSGYTTNYFAALIYSVVSLPIKNWIYEEDDESIALNFIPYVDIMFPISVHNTSQETVGKMYTPYKRCFKMPWKDFGDYAIGINAAYDVGYTPFGIYVGCNYKSTEVPTDILDHRAHYISPNTGIRLRYDFGLLLEVGGSYDCLLKYTGNYQDNSDCANSGLCANFGVGIWGEGASILLKYEHPLYTFFNEDFTPDGGLSHPFEGVKRSMGYISLGVRFGF